ncbi:DUF305 domain-containing protein [Actinoplanes sp. NPDC051513]|uniref:DUF305 domain-containing protein n=1 Tax=Actinoplanes sp. NPDC051513 TaxID=3363908 RepID=UPI0037BC9854
MLRRSSMLFAAVVSVVAAGGLAIAAQNPRADQKSAEQKSSTAADVRVVLPGKPGDQARVTDQEHVTAPKAPAYNTIDATFVQMMIVHHGQAIDMAALAADRAGDDELRALAARIGAAQAPEVAWMRAWLRDRKLPASDPRHDHGSMPGMQSPADLTALAGLRGAAFDRKFAAMMIAHHRGALQMAGDVVRGGADERLREVAGEMSVEQGSEIRRIQQIALAG